MGDDNHRRASDQTEAAPLDPVALTLAIWLGLVVSVTALGRLGQAAMAQAAAQSQLQQSTPRGAASLTTTRPMRFFAYGA